MSRKKFISLLLFIFLITLTAAGCEPTEMSPSDYIKKMGIVNLDYWTTSAETSQHLAPIVAAYQAMHPNVRINVQVFNPLEYDEQLLYAFALDKGPDIFSIHNTWTRKYDDFIEPMPAKVTLDYLETSGPKWRPETKITKKETPLITTHQLRKNFIDQVAIDAIIGDKIYGLPYFVDTLVMFYNINILNEANIAEPAGDWDAMENQIPKITKFDTEGKEIAVSGAALGTSKNIENSFDIISLFMMQVGTPMLSGGMASFNTAKKGSAAGKSPAIGALDFYTSFAHPEKELYSWNDDKINSYAEFTNGTLAYFFGYSTHLKRLKQEAKTINFSYTNFPRLGENPQVNYLNYWLEAVSKKSEHTDYAWDFINFAASEANVKNFLISAQKPTALRSLVEEQKTDPIMGVFASQLLTGKSWYQGAGVEEAQITFVDMIDAINQTDLTIEKALDYAVSRINIHIPKPK